MKIRCVFFAGLLLSATAPFAFADEPPPAISAFFQYIIKNAKVKPSYDKLNVDSDGAVTISNLKLEGPVHKSRPEEMFKLRVSSIKFSDISDLGQGGYLIKKIDANQIESELMKGVTLSIPNIHGEDMPVYRRSDPPTMEENIRDSLNGPKKLTTGPMILKAGPHEYSATGLETGWNRDNTANTAQGNFALREIKIPEAALTAVDSLKLMKAMGYDDVTLDAKGDFNLTLHGDKLSGNVDYSVIGKDIGTVKLSGDADQVPLVAMAIFSGFDPRSEAPDATNSALAPYMPSITLKGMQLRFEEGSLIKKLIPAVAKMQNMDEATVISNVTASVQLGLSMLRNSNFTNQAVSAVSGFLKSPASLTLSLKPNPPVTVQQLMATDPKTLPSLLDVLGASITAND